MYKNVPHLPNLIGYFKEVRQISEIFDLHMIIWGRFTKCFIPQEVPRVDESPEKNLGRFVHSGKTERENTTRKD